MKEELSFIKQHIVNRPLDSVGIVLQILIQYVMYIAFKYMNNLKLSKHNYISPIFE